MLTQTKLYYHLLYFNYKNAKMFSPKKMTNSLFFSFSIFIFIFILHSFTVAADSSSCPINFDYVQTFPWDSSLCHQPIKSGCCQTLTSLFGVGLAKYLNQSSFFYFSDLNTSSSCLSSFQQKLESMAIPPSLFPLCFNDTAEFVNNPNTSCAGIATVHDWTQRVYTVLPIEAACDGDLTAMTRCSMCVDAGMKVNSYIVSSSPNSTKCFFFAILYAAGIVNGFGPEDVRSAACIFGLPLSRSVDGGKSNDRTRRFVLGFVGGVVGICGFLALFVVYRKWAKKKKQDLIHESYVTSVKSMNIGAKWFQLAELEKATNGFSQKNLIGQGGFGVVYRGILSDATEIAVKQILDLDSVENDDEFANEATIISKIRHRNLLPLRGFCVSSDRIHGKRRFLIYDFMPNGSLNDHIFISSEDQRQQLSWPQRKNIILDVAKGLAYLHCGIKPSIFHRDIKATNILLDSHFNARVADFGLAKQNSEGQSHLTTRVAGTHGYLAPEYALYGQLTEKSDVYSFGVVVLEIMSGRRVLDPLQQSSRILITDWAWEMMSKGKVEEVFHEFIREGGPKGVMERFVRVGILCAHVMVALRPTIEEALRMLEGDIDIPRMHDRPSPLGGGITERPFKEYSAFTSDEGSRVTWSSSSR